MKRLFFSALFANAALLCGILFYYLSPTLMLIGADASPDAEFSTARLFTAAVLERGSGRIEQQRTLAALTDKSSLDQIVRWQSVRAEACDFALIERLSLSRPTPSEARIQIVGQLIARPTVAERPFVMNIHISHSSASAGRRPWPYQVRAVHLNVDGKEVL
ncbi:MAG: hypothetical protein PHO89_01250 [Methylacidiphilaceae bacterium]|nr:hypothetical protein [Candidatus Methylacidiphilaceae bacterium]